MTITADTIIKAGAVLGAVIAIGGAVFAVYRWFMKINEKDKKHDDAISRIKEENTLIVFALSACLDGLQQLGANHTVPVAKDKLDKWINQQAHK